jgi:putative flippase GtrA
MKTVRKDNMIQAFKFLIFSISAGVIQTISFTLLYELSKMEYWPAYLIALTLSVLWNFTLNRKFTFKSAANIPLAMSKVAFFYLIFTPLSTLWGDLLTNIGWNAYLVLGLTMITNLISEFLYTKYYVYKNNINTALKEV